MAVEPNYFTCTLGQAAALGITQPHKTVNAFIDAQAQEHPDLPAVGFSIPDKEKPWQYRLFTFLEIYKGSCNLAHHLQATYPELKAKRSIIGLLCPSTPEFLFIWLALMRAGHAVLLIAPQCRAPAIKALCEQCESDLLFHDNIYAEQAAEAVENARESGYSIRTAELPFSRTRTLEDFLRQDLQSMDQPQPQVKSTDVAYLHHTSGTSSGIPKPVPQPHNAAVGVQPSFGSGRDAATFTTTPLFHGGVADLFRAWTSSAPIWLFPGKTVPITAANTLKCLEAAKLALDNRDDLGPVKYFSSVPYVLQMLESDSAGLKALQAMDMVGVGGAALPAEVGDRLVAKGVNLLSRYGSAECGFLMSSQRHFDTDHEWQYLRFPADAKHLRLEQQGDGLRELIVLDGWPHMAKQNRDDGSYATSDLFAPHQTIADAWKYHSRSDSQLTLITGKKFDPAPVESDIAASDLLDDALVFGNGEAYPGVLLFRSRKAEKLSDMELLDGVWPLVQRLNTELPDHAQLSRNMLRPMIVPQQPLEKSSKGTIMRGAAEKVYKEEIESAYRTEGRDEVEVPDKDVQRVVHDTVEFVANRKRRLSSQAELFSFGIDSVAGMQIRSKLQRLLPANNPKLPMTVVEDCGTVSQLANYILKRRHGETEESDPSEDLNRMQELVDDHSNFFDASPKAQANGHKDEATRPDVVVLTGATGALGAHVLHQYRSKSDVRKIYCLVRGANEHAAEERVNNALVQRKLPHLRSKSNTEVVVLPSQLGDSFLGLEQHTYDQVAREATVILHVAWSVNFRMRLNSFVKDNIGGVTNMINLALATPSEDSARFGFCSSVAAVAAYAGSGSIPEAIIDDPAVASSIGYSQSKWVAEQICARASKQTRLQNRTTIFRVGQLAGDRERGVWNASEAWPLMLRSALDTKCLPDLKNEAVNWLPVDLAASALIDGMSMTDVPASNGTTSTKVDPQVYHVVNPHKEPKWRDLLAWLSEEGFSAVKPEDWVEELGRLGVKHPDHPALRLLDHWRRAYGRKPGKFDDAEHSTSGFAVDRTTSAIPSMQDVKPVDKEYFARLWDWIKSDA